MPSDGAALRVSGAVAVETGGEWQVGRHCFWEERGPNWREAGRGW